MSVYDKLSSTWFVEMLQDYAVFETNLNTLGADVYYLALIEQIKDMKDKVEDNQELIIALKDIELLHSVHEVVNTNIEKTIETAFCEAYTEENMAVPKELLSNAFQMAGVM